MSQAPAVIACRGCGQKLRVPADRFGQPGRCPRCGRGFPPVARPGGRGRRWAGRLTAAYAAAVAVGLAVLWAVGEGWWAGTLLLYGPRWVFLVPAVPVGLVAAAYRRPALAPLAAAVLAWAWWGMGYQVRGAFADRVWPADGLVVVTWNAGGADRRPEPLQALLAAEAPDLVLLQEWGGDATAIFGRDWQVARSPGGLTAASRHPVRFVAEVAPKTFRRPGTAALFEVQTPHRTVRVLNVHLPTVRPGLEAVLARGPDGIAELEAVAADQDAASGAARALAEAAPRPVVIAGDFNLPPESRAFRRHWGDMADAFGEAGLGFGWTKRTGWHGARIDHILHNPEWACRWCRVGPDLGSDHRPLLAHLAPAD